MSYKPKAIVTCIDDVKDEVSGMHPAQTAKIIDHIDDLCRLWIERSPYLVMSTVGADGQLDTSPKGDPAGFVKILDRQTLAVPDRPGNHRFDSFQNILETGRIGLLFLVPNRNEVVRVSGTAQISQDQELRTQMAIKGRVPDFAIVVTVEEAFYHCGKASIRSRLWSPREATTTDGLPTYAEALLAHADVGLSLEALEKRLEHNDKNRLYDE